MNNIYTRVSVRQFTEQPVEQEKIDQLLKAAMQAPSAGDQQPWEFYVVKDKAVIEKLAKASPYAGCTAGAPLAVVPCYRTEGLMFPEYAEIDLSIACENLWLMADSLGLGTVWLGIAPHEERMKPVEEAIGLPAGLRAFALFPVGYPARKGGQRNRYDESRIHVI